MKKNWAVLVVAIVLIFLAGMLMAQVREPAVALPITSFTPIYLANGKILTKAHEVVGRVTGTSPIAITLTGAARYSDAASYFCAATGADDSQTLGPQIVNIDGAHFRIQHGAFDTASITYRCVGM